MRPWIKISLRMLSIWSAPNQSKASPPLCLGLAAADNYAACRLTLRRVPLNSCSDQCVRDRKSCFFIHQNEKQWCTKASGVCSNSCASPKPQKLCVLAANKVAEIAHDLEVQWNHLVLVRKWFFIFTFWEFAKLQSQPWGEKAWAYHIAHTQWHVMQRFGAPRTWKWIRSAPWLCKYSNVSNIKVNNTVLDSGFEANSDIQKPRIFSKYSKISLQETLHYKMFENDLVGFLMFAILTWHTR